MKIKAILYDLGDIFFEAHLWRKWMWTYLSSQKYFSGTFREFYELYESYISEVYKGNTSYDDMYAKFVSTLLPKKEVDSFCKFSFSFKEFFETNRELYPYVKETLQKVQDLGIKNVVITDNELTEQEVRKRVIEKHGINNLIDIVITSYDTKFVKPDPLIFQKPLSILEINKGDVLFVAHDYDEIIGAKKVGLKVVEYNNYLETENNPDYKIKTFSEILNLIKK